MPVLDFWTFVAQAPPRGALLGVDPGAKRIGLAISDPDRLIASPLALINRKKFALDAAALFARYAERACVGMIIGLPLDMEGRAGPAAQAARAFARNVLAVQDAPLTFWDERLSTAAVMRQMIAADMSRARRAAQIDAAAAAYMLQGALDAIQERRAAQQPEMD